MQPYYTHGSSRVMTPERRAKLCELLAESHTLEEASEAIGVSIRTVQRERKRDEDFDHEVLLALQKTPDPLQLMEQAARKHWRAAAWLLERRNPEEYARKPVNATSAKKVATALRFVQEMALEAVPAELHEVLYKHVQAAIDEAFRHCFPTMGKWGTPKFPRLPLETPLADVQACNQREANVRILPDCADALRPASPTTPPSDVALRSPIGRVEAAERQALEVARRAAVAELKRLLTEQSPAELSPKTREATPVACDTPPVDPLYVSFEEGEAVLTQQAHEREQRQSHLEFRRACDDAEQRPSVFFPSTAAVQQPPKPGARRYERQKARAAEKKAKAARKRAQAQRRRAA
ncbi:hypothetical protein [Lacipirellula limnantheis]|uniref:Transposase IS30-like HTH domain-containing protein n=1 Tax=Lacipirellula limnantheis TaxID=2528024 RepID=A0A517U2W8_9BACT|nr:hypothetical protein [Lacipirellula limnantheis]QDT74953.1 hypothetical protein I41_41570 [Lacipirellula limnantheis]